MAFPNAKRPASAVAENRPQEVHHAGQRDASSLSHPTPKAQAPRHHCNSDNQQLIALSRIKDGGAQMRVEKIRIETVHDYAEDMLNGDSLPSHRRVLRRHRLLAWRGLPPRRGGTEDRARVRSTPRSGKAHSAMRSSTASVPMPRTACAEPKPTSGMRSRDY